jgi:hypothetical protein
MGDPVIDARDLVRDLFPEARWAVVTGSVVTGRRTPGSDLDIVVFLEDDDLRTPHRDSRRHRDWPVELFVHDGQTLSHYLAKDLAARQPTMHRMVAGGVPVVGDPGPWQTRCAEVLAAGPPPLTAAERERRRYGLTDLLDDLVHAIDPDERTVIAAEAWTEVARQALALADHWTGGGKWLLRELCDLDERLARRWLDAHGDPERIAELARAVLDQHGGPLFEGYRVTGERPRG